VTVASEVAIVRAQPAPHAIEWTAEQRQMIRDTYANGASDEEFAVLMETARQWGLDPFKKQIYFVKRFDRQKNRDVWSVQVAIDGMRARAERTGLYDGQDEPEFVEDDRGNILLCKVRVYRKGWSRPAVGVAYFREYVQNSPFWTGKPHIMIAKCAEALGLRKAFPEELAGGYTPEEMGNAEVTAERPARARGRASEVVDAQHEPAQIGAPAERTRIDMREAHHAVAPAAREDGTQKFVVPQVERDEDEAAPVDALALLALDLDDATTAAEMRAAWEMHQAAIQAATDDTNHVLAKARDLQWEAAMREGHALTREQCAAVFGKGPLPEELPTALRALARQLAKLQTPEDAVATWRAHRTAVGALDEDGRKLAWNATWRRLADVCRVRGAADTLRKLVAEADKQPTPPDGTSGPKGTPANDGASARGTAGESAGASGTQASAAPDALAAARAKLPAWAEYLDGKSSVPEVENAVAAHIHEQGDEDAAMRVAVARWQDVDEARSWKQRGAMLRASANTAVNALRRAINGRGKKAA
jgi:phage recombination protein Bet